jgi:hypothetical protein
VQLRPWGELLLLLVGGVWQSLLLILNRQLVNFEAIGNWQLPIANCQLPNFQTHRWKTSQSQYASKVQIRLNLQQEAERIFPKTKLAAYPALTPNLHEVWGTTSRKLETILAVPGEYYLPKRTSTNSFEKSRHPGYQKFLSPDRSNTRCCCGILDAGN